MKNQREIEELIDRYCLGQLTPEEYRIFENWLANDAELAITTAQHQQLIDAFKIYKNNHQVKQQLQAIHDEMEFEQLNFKSTLKVVDAPKNNIIKLIKRYKIIAVAAVVAVVAVSTTFIALNFSGVGNGKQQTAYQELRREVEKIKRSQKAIINDINSDDSKNIEPISDKSFTGSGFVIAEDGYILTSYHVVADAKQVYISNHKFEQLKVKTVLTDKSLDLALLKIDDKDFIGFKEIPYNFKQYIADPGERVFTLGYPREDLVYGEGSISSYTGYEGDTSSYQISIPVNPGNSGGPLFDNQANLLGIISGRNSNAEGASFAVKSKWLNDYIRANEKDAKIANASGKSLKGLDRASQIKKLKDFIFMVKVYN